METPNTNTNTTMRKNGRPELRDRLPSLPNDPDAECGLLCSLVLGGMDVFAEIAGEISEGVFYTPANQILFGVFATLCSARKPIDFVVVLNRLREMRALEEIGG